MLLRFFYDYLHHFFDRKDFEPILADTDSMYVAFSSKQWEQLVRPGLVDEYRLTRHDWLPREADGCHDNGRDDDPRDNRTPGLFHIEFQGDFICALNPKTYLAQGGCGDAAVCKMSTKGCPKKINDFVRQDFLDVLRSGKSLTGQVRNFKRDLSGAFGRFNMTRTALSYLMIKRKVLPDGINTVPLDI